MLKETLSIPSNDGKHQLHILCWRPDGNPLAVLQIAHGMTEFIDRYDDFARYLCERNIAVIGHDHLGHGQSVKNDDELGYFADKNGKNIVIMDMYHVTKKTKTLFPNIPLFLLGHSMGSYFTRKYITLYGKKIDGAIIMGTGEIPLPTLQISRILTSFIMKQKGPHYRSKLIDKLAFGSYLNKIVDPRTPKDWLTRDEKVVDAYLANKYNTFLFTTSAFHDFLSILAYCTKKIRFENIPRTLPILFAYGTQDPVGNWGVAPNRLYYQYLEEGFYDVQNLPYAEARHELLNEINKTEVYHDLGNWIISHI